VLTPWIAVTLAAAAGLMLGLTTPTVLRRLPEPDPGADPVDHGVEPVVTDPAGAKVPYADLATRPFASVVGALTAAAVAVAAWALPVPLLPAWLVLGTLGLLLAAIDARTTWLPLSLTRVAWLAMAGAVTIGGLLGGWPQAVRGVVGFGLAGVLFGAIWLLTRGGFGFGDVRYAPLVGAAAASASWTLLAWALVLGSLVGAVVGLVRLAAGRRGGFAYAPSILAGGYLAVTLAALTT
jgi:leader peptidase (prepilin peptidase)/N-methyltransferase